MVRINYDSWDRSPRKKGGLRVAIAVALVVLLAAVLALAVFAYLNSRDGSGLGTAGATKHVVTVAQPVTTPAGQLSLGACIDPTGSLVPSFAPAIRGDLQQAVAGLAPGTAKLPTDVTSTPQSALALTVREVTTDSFSSDLQQYSRSVVVPGIRGLAQPRPDASAPNYDSQLRAWYSGYGAIQAERSQANIAAVAGAQVIGTLPLDRAGWSGISACISALLATVPSGGRHSYLLASDLQENVAPQLAGSFHGAPLVIVQACDTGEAGYCNGLLQRFESEMRELDVGPVTVLRPEVASQAIARWVRSGEVTS